MLPGVYEAQKKDGTIYYRASITFHRKHISLGSFSEERSASDAYEYAAYLLNTPSLLPDMISETNTPLSFEKTVILMNFRDHRIYFKTPIYLGSSYFDYYLSPKLVLKFDIDDLFYYSQHKIFRRDGHLFVNDYGMQVNLLSRYGIKNYARPGKDYRFVNGDPHDFRYSNLVNMNRYTGVTYHESEKLPYIAKIHINGDFIVGKYASEEEAAIAYNKAVDLCHRYGIKKNFQTNFIPEYSAREYAHIYHTLPVSKRLLHYLQTSGFSK
jgi:hypothetical protein